MSAAQEKKSEMSRPEQTFSVEMDATLINDERGTASSGHGTSQARGTSSIPEASANMINSIIGAGIIGMPFALKEAGFVAGIVLLAGMGLITDFSVRLIVDTGKRVNEMTYQGMIQSTLGTAGQRVLIVSQFFFPMFAMIGYTIIIGQNFPKIFDQAIGESFLSDRHVVIVVMTLCVMLPLTLNKDIESLARWSALSLLFVVGNTFIIVIRGSQLSEESAPITIVEENVVQAAGVMAFAYVCHHNSFMIYSSLRNACPAKFAVVTHLSLGASFSGMLFLGIGGYLAFGSATDANVFDNFPAEDTVTNVGRFLFSCTIMLTYPLEAFVTREVFLSVVSPNKEASPLVFYGFTVCMALSIMGVGLLTEDLGVVLELNGVVFANLVAFALPGLAGFLVVRDTPWHSRQRLPSLLLLLFSIVLLFVGLGFILADLGEGKDE